MKKSITALASLFITSSVFASEVTVTINTQDNEPLPGAVVYLTPTQPSAIEAPTATAIMDQVARKFEPHILAVQKDTPVSFPNSDSIKHHVYSFSPAKVFELQLYRGSETDPVIFGKTGTVELGCNVHDWMLGYIYVVDTPYFKQNDESNVVTVDVPNGEYELKVWHPRLKDKDASQTQTVNITAPAQFTVSMQQSLLPAAQDLDDEIDEFSDYE